jgi:hypothetical protein
MHKMQRAIETGNFSDLQLEEQQSHDDSANTAQDNEDIGFEGGSANDSGRDSSCAKQKVPVVNSFFPFSYTDNSEQDNSNLNEIILFNSMPEGSVLEHEL